MAADRSFVFGFRTGHCVRGIVLFGGVAILDLGWALFATSTVIRAVNGVVAALLALLAAQMVRHLVARVRGTRRVVVGARMLTSPTGFALGSPTAEESRTATCATSPRPAARRDASASRTPAARSRSTG